MEMSNRENDLALQAGVSPAKSAVQPSPEEGVALIRAFIRIVNPKVRAAIILLISNLAEAARGHPQTLESKRHRRN
jgi:hypothetical protein